MKNNIISALIFAAFPFFAVASEMDAALDSIEKNNTALAAMRQENDAQRLQNMTGLNLPDPEVEFAYMWGQPATVRDKINVGVSQSFDFATLSGAKKRVALCQNDLVALQYKQSRLELIKEARTALINLIFINAVSNLDNEKLRAYKTLAAAQKKALDNGGTNVIGLNKINLELLGVENEVRLNEVERKALLLEIQRLNGGQILPFTLSEYPVVIMPTSFDEFYAMAEAQSPMLAYVRSEVELSRQMLSLAKSENLPAFSLGYVNELIKGDNHHGVSLGVSIPLWSNSGKVKAAKASLNASQARSEDAATQLYGNILTQYERTLMLRQTADEYARMVAALSNREYLKKALDAGQISIIDYINETNLYYEALEKALEAERDFQLAYAMLISYIE